MQIAGELYDSLANGPGMRYVLFTQGCTMHCDGCQNKHTWDKNSGVSIAVDEILEHIKESPFIEGVTLSGGDPLEQPEEVLELCRKIKEYDKKLTILLYTGRTLQEIFQLKNLIGFKIIANIDYIVDGRFEKDNIDGAVKYTGSANQRFIDLNKKRECAKLENIKNKIAREL